MAARMYVVGVDLDATSEQRNAFTQHLRQQGLGFWHHVSPFWIVADSKGKTTARELRDKLSAVMPGVNTMVVQVSPHTWAGVAPKAGHEWLQKYLAQERDRWTSETRD